MLRRTLFLLTSAIFIPACPGGGGDDTTAGGTSTSGAASSGTTGDATTTDATSTSTPTSSTTGSPTTDGTTGDATTGGSTGPICDPGGLNCVCDMGACEQGLVCDDGVCVAGLDCGAIPAGPFDVEPVFGGYAKSEDLAFDGAGNLALKRDGEVVLVTADQQEALLADGLPQVYGTRFATNGDLLLALPQQGVLQAIAPDGTATDVAAGLQSPNGVYVDPTGGVWLTEFGGSRVVRFDAQWNKATVYEGPLAASANGVVLDPARGLLFFTNYGAGRLLKIAVDAQGVPDGEPVEVAAVAGAKLDGLALDACGHVYAVDQGNGHLFRVRLDAQGAAAGDPEQLAVFPKNVANAQFGAGPGFDPESLYAAGNPGDVYRVAVGVPGAPIGLP